MQRPTRATATLFVLFLLNSLNFFDRNILGAVVEPVRREWGLGDAQIGWIGTAFTLLYAVVGLPPRPPRRQHAAHLAPRRRGPAVERDDRRLRNGHELRFLVHLAARGGSRGGGLRARRRLA